MRHRKLQWIAFTALFAALACTVPKVHAQLAVTTATLSGTVTDTTGAVVPQANVKLTSPEKGIVRTYVTDASGHYSLTQLPPATYSLSIQVGGFKAYQQNGIILDAAQSATQDVSLTPGANTEQVVVNAQASSLNPYDR